MTREESRELQRQLDKEYAVLFRELRSHPGDDDRNPALVEQLNNILKESRELSRELRGVYPYLPFPQEPTRGSTQ